MYAKSINQAHVESTVNIFVVNLAGNPRYEFHSHVSVIAASFILSRLLSRSPSFSKNVNQLEYVLSAR